MNIVSKNDNSRLRNLATQHLNNLLKKYRNENILLLLSGGSSLTIVPGIEAKYFSPRLTISVLDERYTRNKENNFAKFASLDTYKKSRENGAEVIDTRPQNGESQDDLAKRYKQAFMDWIQDNPNGKVIVTQGIGEDAHTAGIMPYPENPKLFSDLFEKEKWVTAYNAGSKNKFPHRITTTLPFLRDRIDHSVMYIQGDNKKDALHNILLEKGELHVYPGRIIHEMKDVTIFTDQA